MENHYESFHIHLKLSRKYWALSGIILFYLLTFLHAFLVLATLERNLFLHLLHTHGRHKSRLLPIMSIKCVNFLHPCLPCMHVQLMQEWVSFGSFTKHHLPLQDNWTHAVIRPIDDVCGSHLQRFDSTNQTSSISTLTSANKYFIFWPL